ncbi:LPXTG cell wall anchor domain-containing protein [Enterococcus durans]
MDFHKSLLDNKRKNGSLPKTNERKSSFIAFCGTILVGIIGYAFVRKIR